MSIKISSNVPVLDAGDGGSVAPKPATSPKAAPPKPTPTVEVQTKPTPPIKPTDAVSSKAGIDNAALKKADATTKASQVTANSPNEVLVKQPQIRAMLDTIAYAEGTGSDYGKVVNGLVKSGPLAGQRNVSVTDLTKHPKISVQVVPPGVNPKFPDGLNSTAAGRYQFLGGTWDEMQKKLKLPDFSPTSQDLAAVQLMKRRGMIEPLLKGDIKTAVNNGTLEWASLPKSDGTGSYVGQNAKAFSNLESVYNDSYKKYSAGSTGQGTSSPTNTTGSVIPPSGLSKSPQKKAAVEQLQNNYVKLGLMTEAEKATGVGEFGNRTERATKSFQQSMGVQVTGKFDNSTRDAMADLYKGNIKRGTEGEDIMVLQQQLSKSNPSFAAALKAENGTFGKATEDALKAFQKDNNIKQTGVLGPTTYKAMYGNKTENIATPNTPAQTPTASLNAHHLNQLDGDKNGSNNNCAYASTHMALSFLGVKGYQVLNPTATSTKTQIADINKQNYDTTMALRKAGGQGTIDSGWGHIVDTQTKGNPGVVKAANSIAGVTAVSLYDSVTNLKQEDRHTSYLSTMQTAFENGEKTAFIVGGSPRTGWGDDATKNAAYSQTGNRPYAGAHFVAVVGYDPKTKSYDVLDPIADYPLKITGDQLNKYMDNDGAVYREIAQISVK